MERSLFWDGLTYLYFCFSNRFLDWVMYPSIFDIFVGFIMETYAVIVAKNYMLNFVSFNFISGLKSCQLIFLKRFVQELTFLIEELTQGKNRHIKNCNGNRQQKRQKRDHQLIDMWISLINVLLSRKNLLQKMVFLVAGTTLKTRLCICLSILNFC